MDTSTHPIAALSTPPGRGALAVIRLTGEGSQSVFSAIILEGRRFKKELARRIGLYTVLSDCNYSSYGEIGDDGKIGRNRQNPGNNGHFVQNCPKLPSARQSPPVINNSPEIIAGPPSGSPPTEDINITNFAGVNVPGRPPSNIPPNIIDEVTAIKYDAPRSFTGEEMVEIFCHGGTAITGRILDRLFKNGARPAARGEFSRRAFVNGKICLLKAESIAGLIESQTGMRLQSAQLAYQGKQLESLEILKRRVINILSDVESRIEFGGDDDVAESTLGQISANRVELSTIIAELEEELRRGERVKAFDEGINIALAGPANAGKSSLFNEILGYDRSIVHDTPGTTRDIVSERITFEGVSVKLFDSAGIRRTSDIVEKQGIERTMSAVRGAHIVIWVTSAAEPLGDEERQSILEVINSVDNSNRYNHANVDNIDTNNPNVDNINVDNIAAPLIAAGAAAPNRPQCRVNNNILLIINKIDVTSSPEKIQFCKDNSIKCVEASLTEKINVDNLFDVISAVIHTVTGEIPVPEIIVNQRHSDIVASMITDLRDCVNNFDREEVSAHYLKAALGRLDEFLGCVAGDEILDGIFEKFCIGK